ncbi:manganese catalase family protein [Subtercola sp. YIM 133946]
MYFHVQSYINEIAADEPDPGAANALQEGLGGQFGEMRTMMQYLFQSMNFRGPSGKPYRDLIQGVGTEEISHVELIGTTISRLLDGSPKYTGKPTDPLDTPGAGGAIPLNIALSEGNIHHYLVGAQGALPVDSVGNPWSGSYVYNSGNLSLDLLYNLMLESTGRLQKCRVYEMTENKTARSTLAYLIVRDQAHENAFAKALESLGVAWNTLLPIPKTNAEKFPEVKKLLDLGLQSKQYSFDLRGQSEAGKIFQGPSPSNDGTMLDASEQAPEGVPSTISVERFEEFAPGLDPALLELIQATADMELADVENLFGPVDSGAAKAPAKAPATAKAAAAPKTAAPARAPRKAAPKKA